MSLETLPQSMNPVPDTRSNAALHPRSQDNTPQTAHGHLNPYKKKIATASTATKFHNNTSPLACSTLKNIKKLRTRLNLNETLEVQLHENDGEKRKENFKHKVIRNSTKHTQSKIPTVSKFLNDSDWIGFLPETPSSTASRFWIQNVQSIDTNDNFLHFRSILEAMQMKHVEFIGFTETRLPPFNSYINENIKAAYQMHNPGGTISSTNTLLQKGDQLTKQFGGVLSAVHGRLATRFIRTVKEKYGRYQYSDFHGKKYYLRIYIVYRVCQNTEKNAGNNTAWVDQKTILQKSDEVTIEPRKHITKTLLQSIKEDIKCKRQVLVLGDFNENVLLENGINNMMNKIGLVNLITQHIPESNTIRTYDRGSSVIDGAWSTPVVSDYVVNMAFAPFYTEIDSDHRPLIFDLDLKGLLDARDVSITPPSGRRLKFTCPKRVKAYVDDVKIKWKEQKITSRLHQIEMYFAENGKDDFITQTLMKLDTQIQEILSSAEKHCCNVPTNSMVQWSVKLKNALTRIRNAKLELRKIGDVGDHGCGGNYRTMVKPLVQELQNARSELKLVKKKDVDLREAHLEERALQASVENPRIKFEKHLQQLKRIEKQIRDAKRVRFALKGREESGVEQILIPDRSTYSEAEQMDTNFDHFNIDVIWKKVNTGNWKDIPKWEMVEQQHLVESMSAAFMRKHLAQAQGTPLTSERWDTLLQDEETQRQILDGSFTPPPDTPDALCMYLKHLQRPSRIADEFPFRYDLEDFKTFIKNAKEKTSSSPSRRHYGHWKSIQKYLPDVFADLHAILVLVMQHTILLPRLVKTVMTLLKKEEQPYIHRLRPILLVEVEIQAISSSQWAQAMSKSSEKHGIISNSQYGGRKGRQAQSAVLNKLLYYDINNQFVRDYTIIDEDLKANYDRELCTLASLEARKAGATFRAGLFMNDFIKSQQFHVKTKYGVCNSAFSYQQSDPIWGLGQGLAWSGESWKASSSTIDECMHEKCTGMIFQSPDNTVAVSKLMDLYIDDSAQGCNFASDQKTLLEQTEYNLQLHAQLVFATGGQLALDKCKYYDIRHKFEKGIPRVLSTSEFDSALLVKKDFESELEPIRLLNHNQTHKTLGYFVCPSRNQTDTVKQLKDLAKKWVARVSSSSLKDYEILLAYESVLLRQWAYRLPGSMLTYEQCNEIMKLVTPTLLNAMHSQRNITRTILYAGDIYGGMAFKHLYDFAAEEKMKFLSMHIRRNDTTGKLLRISMQTTQLQIGTEKPFYNLSYDQYAPLCTPTWFTNLWSYMDSRLLEMDLSIGVTFQQQRQNDRFIMDLLTPHFNSDTLQKINRVRVALQVLTLADIADDGGRKLLPGVACGVLQRKSKFNWPRQPLYTPWLKHWQQACSLLKRYISANRLGAWIKTHQQWTWETNQEQNILKNGTKYYRKSWVRSRYVFLQCDPAENEVWQQADVYLNKERPYLASTVTTPHTRHINTYTSTDWSNVFPNMFTDDFDASEIIDAINDDDIVAASDGSVVKEKGSAAFCISRRDGEILYQYATHVHGDLGDIHSSRAEMMAMLGIVVFFRELCKNHKFQHKPSIPVYSDSTTAIKSACENIFISIKNVFENDIDIKTELKWNIKLSPCNYLFYHVRSHQGDNEDINELPLPQQLNRKVDELAGSFLCDALKDNEDNYMVPFLAAQKISFRTPYNRLVYKIASKINEYKDGHETEKLIAGNWEINRENLKLIDWLPFRRAITKMKREKRYMCVKTIHDQWHTQYRSHKWGQSDSSLCPLCNLHPETTTHVLQCPSETSKSFKTGKILEFRATLDKLETSPALRNRLINTIIQFTSGCISIETPVPEGNERQSVEICFEVQSKLGLRNLFRGLICREISEMQEKWYCSNKHKKRNNIAKWDVTVRSGLINMANELWMHRCKVVHDENKLTIDGFTRSSAYDLNHKLKRIPWSLPSASRHLLEKDRDFFLKGKFTEVSSWLRRVQYGVQEIESMERRTSTDIRTWVQKDTVLLAASPGASQKRTHKNVEYRMNSMKIKPQTQLTLFDFSTASIASTYVNNWYVQRKNVDKNFRTAMVITAEYSGRKLNARDVYFLCDVLHNVFTLHLVD